MRELTPVSPPTSKRTFPLWFVLIVPFITIIVGVSILTSYLSLQNSQHAVNDMTEQLLGEINARIENHLEYLLETPHLINHSTADAIRRGEIDIHDRDALQQYVWQEVQIYPTVTSIYFGNTAGGIVTGGREGADGSLYVIRTEELVAGPFTKYATDSAGNLGETIFVVPDFDARTRPWYTGAVAQHGAYWNPPYVLSTGQDLAIAASLPVYDEAGDLLGVTSVDIFLSHISNFLRNVQIGKTGQAYIVDQTGVLIASSIDTPVITRDAAQQWQRLPAVESLDPITAASAQYLVDNDDFARIESDQTFKLAIGGTTYDLWVTPYHDPRGLDWITVIVIPDDEFLAEINDHNRVTLLLTVLAILLAVAAGILTVWQVSRPLARLSQAAAAIAKGNWHQTVTVQGTREVCQLGAAFNTMSRQLQETFNHLEQLVAERTQALSDSEARYRAIVEDQTELICRFLPGDYTLTFVNGAYCRFLGKTRDELINQSFMPALPPEDQQMLTVQLARLSPNQPAVTVEHRVRMPNQSLHWMQWVNRALFDDDQQIVEIQAVGRDITERKQFEQMLETALAHETELNKLKTHFISTVSHEFRTPMAAILTASETLDNYRDRIPPDKQEVYFKRIKDQIHYMSDLLRDVLTINRAQHGRLEFKPEELDIVALFHSVVSEIHTTADKTFTVEYVVEGSCTVVTADRQLLRLIAANLVSNAIKCSPEHAPITISLNCTPSQIVFSVKDEGIGIPAEAQARIFEPFFRADNVRTIPGTGLGLAIVKHSIEQHGGTITFDSTEGQGTTFTVTLPNELVSD